MNVLGEYLTKSETETVLLGKKLAAGLVESAVIAFVGELGSGKTTLIRAIAGALGADPLEVASPTFTIVNVYFGREPIYHIDLFRIKKPSEIDELGLWEIVDGDGISLIEWADRYPKLVPENAFWVSLSREGPNTRRIIIDLKRPVFKKGKNEIL